MGILEFVGSYFWESPRGDSFVRDTTKYHSLPSSSLFSGPTGYHQPPKTTRLTLPMAPAHQESMNAPIKDIIIDHRPELPVSLPHDVWEESQGLKQEFNVGSLSLLEITQQAAAGVGQDYISSGKEPIAFIRD